MTYDRAEIFRNAWARTKADHDYCEAYDWRPGPTYGRKSTPTAAERRTVFAKHLRNAWTYARNAAQRRKAAITAFANTRPVAELKSLLFALDCGDFHRARELTAMAALRAELATAQAIAA
ncbi:hypothetical protein PANO111632_05070 [Paracoccus nototheniae]|uniref:Uncharacterized protein n=1 Tax=Paracoccus nototheniae TaxID=2489002 RepID=A0ABW4DVV8_9RHOB|nr:hypothetical protein [Paracoccus nototheniae]